MSGDLSSLLSEAGEALVARGRQYAVSLLRVATADDIEVAEKALRLIEDRGFHRGRSLIELLKHLIHPSQEFRIREANS